MFSSLGVISGNLAVLLLVATIIYAFTNYSFGVDRGKVLFGGGSVALILLAVSHLLITTR